VIGHDRQVWPVLLGGADRDDDSCQWQALLQLLARQLPEPKATIWRGS
jgi:hypothetical protein